MEAKKAKKEEREAVDKFMPAHTRERGGGAYSS